MTLTINIPVVVVVVVVVVVAVIGRCRFQQFFFILSYHAGHLSLLCSTSFYAYLVNNVQSSVNENQWQGDNNLYENM